VARPRTVSDDEIVAATFTAIEQHGAARLTLADVGAVAGVSPAALVQRFGSKHGLLVAAARRAGEDVDAEFDDALARRGPALTTLVEMFAGFFPKTVTPEVLANHLSFLQLDLVDPDLRVHARAHALAVQRGIRRLLDAAVERKELRRGAPTKRLAAAFQSTYNGTLITWALTGRGALEASLRRELRFVLEPYAR
jgi:AcrR family transcriptional regulator